MCFGHLRPIYAYIRIKQAINARRRRDFCSFTVIFLENALKSPLEMRGGEKNLENAPPERRDVSRVD